MKRRPTEREHAVAHRRAEGLTLGQVGEEFGLMPNIVRLICLRVRDYDRATAMLRDDPASIEALALLGHIKPLVREILRYRGIKQLTDLEGLTMEQILSWPNVGRRSTYEGGGAYRESTEKRIEKRTPAGCGRSYKDIPTSSRSYGEHAHPKARRQYPSPPAG